MKKALLLITTAVMSFFANSCSSPIEEPGIVDPSIYSFAPRDVNYIWAVPMNCSEKHNAYWGIAVKAYNQKIESDGILYPNWKAISKVWKNVDRSIPEIEAYLRKFTRVSDSDIVPIEQNFDANFPNYEDLHFPYDAKEQFCGICLNYYTEGIVSMKISADRPLFGEEAGASLNAHFQIQELEINSGLRFLSSDGYYSIDQEDRNLFSNDNPINVADIDGWLKHKPMVMPYMSIVSYESLSEEEANKILWTFEMTTTAGKYFKVSHRGMLNSKDFRNLEYFPYLPEFMSEATLVE